MGYPRTIVADILNKFPRGFKEKTPRLWLSNCKLEDEYQDYYGMDT